MSDLPKLIHRYEFVQRLGRGGMGEVYLARDPLLDRYVALKVLRAGFEGDELRERFAREARSAARLAHINIVTIFDVGEHEGMPYIAMEYVRGETLAQIIQRKADLPLLTKLNYMDELCAGLAHAHRAGIVHRDIKPANLMVSADGTLKILDFGIARLSDSSMTEAGMVVGTLNYMSPEQITGHAIDHRSDIFAVGAVFYELIAYQQAFPGRIDTGVLSQIMEGRFTPLTAVARGIDPNLSRVIDKALARNPDDRYPDLTAMREDLARVRQRIDPRLLDPQSADDNDDKTIVIETPVGTPRTPRKGTDRSEIRRRREEELRNSLNAAREAFADNRYEEASAACERVLIIQPENEEALNLIERARDAIERQQLHEWINQAQTAFDRGDLIRARDLVSFALSRDAASPDARKLRAAIDKANRRKELDSAIERGRSALASGDAFGAMAAAQEALGLDPSDADAGALKRDVDAFVAKQRKQAEDDRRAREIVLEARRRFAKGEMADAIAVLRAFSPPHPAVTAALQELRTEAKALRERELERQVAAEVRQARAALANDDVIAAEAAVARARGISSEHQDLTAVSRAIEVRRAELAARKKADEDARRLAEEQARLRAEQEARERAAEEARRKEEEARRAELAARKAEEDARRLAEEQARLRAEQEARERAAEEARRKEEEARRAELAARKKADEDARRLAEEQARLRAEQQARERAAEEARRKEEEEEEARRAELAARKKADEDARRLAEEQARLRAEQEARERAAEEARRKEEEARRAELAARKKAEEDARRLAEEQARLRAEQQARERAAEEARRKEEEARRAELAAREKADEDARRLAEEQARLRAEQQARERAAEEARRKEEEARRAELAAREKAEEDARRLAEEQARLRAEQQARERAAEEARRKEEEVRRAELAARQKAEEDARRLAEEQARLRAEQAARDAAAEEARRKEEEARRTELAARKKADEDARRKAAEEDRRRKEAHQRRQEEERLRKQEEQRAKAQQEQQRKAEEDRQRKADEDQRREPTPAPPASAETLSFPTLDTPPSGGAAPLPAPPVAHVPPPAIREGTGRPQRALIAAAAVVVAALAGAIYWAQSGDGTQVTNDTTTAVTSVVTSVPPTTTTISAGIATGLLVIDASPWAEIVEVVGDAGQVKLPANHTPLAVTVPEGEYRITLRHPSDRSPRTMRARVTTGQPGRAFAEFSTVDVDAYFRRSATQSLDGR